MKGHAGRRVAGKWGGGGGVRMIQRVNNQQLRWPLISRAAEERVGFSSLSAMRVDSSVGSITLLLCKTVNSAGWGGKPAG